MESVSSSGEAEGSTPGAGNYGGGTYTVGAEVANEAAEVAAHEALASDLTARRGGILLDYLRASLPDQEGVWEALRGFLGVFTERGRGWHGWYDRSWEVLDGGLVAACSDPDRARTQGVLVDLPGRACAALGDDLPGFFLWCFETGHIARADYAIDDRQGLLTRERVLECVASGGLVSRWQGVSEVSKHKGGKRDGWTIYLGAREGEAMVRIYDKAAQLGLSEQLVRFEFETKGEFAHALAAEYWQEGAAAVVGQINRRMRFAIPDPGDSNKRRWLPCTWWVELLGTVDQGRALCPGEKVQATIGQMRQFVERQAAPALAAVVAADGGRAWLDQLVVKGRDRWRSKHMGAVALAEAERGERDRRAARVHALRDVVYGVRA